MIRLIAAQQGCPRSSEVDDDSQVLKHSCNGNYFKADISRENMDAVFAAFDASHGRWAKLLGVRALLYPKAYEKESKHFFPMQTIHKQDGVPETLESLRKAGINFWMLTGVKQNTAIQIALSWNFISSEPKEQLLFINGKTEEEVFRTLERVLLTITSAEPKELAFVMDGVALEIVLKRYKEAFTELAILSRTAICCRVTRVTPSQKAQDVE